MRELLFRKDEQGFTTAGCCIAILLVLALVFGAFQAYWIGSRSGQIQYVADAGALAADELVAEFITYAQVADAVVLSLSLLGLTAYAVAVVAAFIPGGASVSSQLSSVGEKVLKARDSFRKTAAKGLDSLQKALPALCAAKAMSCIRANAQASGIEYMGAALTFPVEGEKIALPDGSSADEAASEMEESRKEVAKEVEKQQQSQDKLDRALKRAYEADCGSKGMCMRERAKKLASLSGGSNPNYSVIEAWSFSVALNRAKAYYKARFEREPGASAAGSPEEVSLSVARKRFYEYALRTVSAGSVTTNADGQVSVDLKYLPRSIAEVKKTSLVTDAIYPYSVSGDAKVIHSYNVCPGAEGGVRGYASVSQIESGQVKECSVCKFSATTLGRVPGASTSISNGFEYYYRIVVEASYDYAQAQSELEKSSKELDGKASSLGETLEKALKELAAQRIDPKPAGRFGCVCIVVAPGQKSSIGSVFTGGGASIPARIAISGATLAPNEQVSQGDVISQIGSNLVDQSVLGSGLVKKLFGAWGSLLKAYSNANDGIEACFEKVLGAIPLAGTTLSEKAAETFRGAMEEASLQPVDMTAYEPVLVNTQHILQADGGTVATTLLKLKQAASTLNVASVDAVGLLEEQLQEIMPGWLDLSEGKIVIASLDLSSFGLGSSTWELSFPLPKGLVAAYREGIGSLRGYVQENG